MPRSCEDQEAWIEEILEGLASELDTQQYLTCPVCGLQDSLDINVVSKLDQIRDGWALFHVNKVGNTHWLMVVPDGLSPIPRGFETFKVDYHYEVRRKKNGGTEG